MDPIHIEVNAQGVVDRLGRIPVDVGLQIEAAFRRIVGGMVDVVIHNINTELSGPSITEHPYRKPGALAAAVLGTVTRIGDVFVGEVSVDTQAVPYARILEEGGVIRPHSIRPRGLWLSFPTASLKESQQGGEVTTEEFVIAHEVQHPGARIVAYHYLLNALATVARTFDNDLEEAIVQVIRKSE